MNEVDAMITLIRDAPLLWEPLIRWKGNEIGWVDNSVHERLLVGVVDRRDETWNSRCE